MVRISYIAWGVPPPNLLKFLFNTTLIEPNLLISIIHLEHSWWLIGFVCSRRNKDLIDFSMLLVLRLSCLFHPMFRVSRLGLAWLGLAWLGLAWLGLAWLGLAWLGSVLALCVLAWTSSPRSMMM